MKKFQDFQKAYDDAIETINLFLLPGKYEPQLDGLTKWLMETDANPYSYLPEHWAGRTNTAEGFASLLGFISHAVHDDGEITFVTVNGEPRIVFANQHDDDFRSAALTETEKDIETRPWPAVRTRRPSYVIEVLDITPNEFGPLFDKFYANDIKRFFMSDAVMGVEQAAEHYRKYSCWDEAWIDEARKEYD